MIHLPSKEGGRGPGVILFSFKSCNVTELSNINVNIQLLCMLMMNQPFKTMKYINQICLLVFFYFLFI